MKYRNLFLIITASQMLAESPNLLKALYDEPSTISSPKVVHQEQHQPATTLTTYYQKIAALGFPLSLCLSAWQFKYQRNLARSYEQKIKNIPAQTIPFQTPNSEDTGILKYQALSYVTQSNTSPSTQTIPEVKQNIVKRMYNLIAKIGFPITGALLFYFVKESYNTSQAAPTTQEINHESLSVHKKP